MQIKSHSTGPRPDTSVQDAARYGQRLGEISDHLATVPGADAEKARGLLKQAADAAQEAARLLEGTQPTKLRLHVNTANKPDLLVEAARYVLERNPGDTPVTLRHGLSQQNLPFGVSLSARLMAQLRALLGDDAVWTERR